MSAADLFWIAPLFPLIVSAAVGCGILRRRSSVFAIAALASALAICAFALFAVATGVQFVVAVPWLAVGGRTLSLAVMLDPLAAVIATVVTLVALVVFVYAAFYMADDPRSARFFGVMSLFVAAMLVLTLAADLITLFIAWEIIGVCSYLLIGFWYERPDVPQAATQALLVTRIADMALLAGIVLLIQATGTTRIDAILQAIASGSVRPLALSMIASLLFIGAAGKSAQVPFHGWLPDAMLGPTPVSALLHSATMVAAGVFLVGRLFPLFLAAPGVLALVGWTGAITAVTGGIAALTQTDLKRLLAYSTLSQLGLMFVGLGAGSLIAGMLLLVAQALYKATLFLAAGAIEHATGSRELRQMRGVAWRLRLVGVAFALAVAALAGLPITLALPPKDPVLAAALIAGSPLFAVTVLASFVTALYSARMFAVLFVERRTSAAQPVRAVAAGLAVPTFAMALLLWIGLLADAHIAGRPLSSLLGGLAPASVVTDTIVLAMAIVGVAIGLVAFRSNPFLLSDAMRHSLAERLDIRRAYRVIAAAALAMSRFLDHIESDVFDALTARIVECMRMAVRRASRIDRLRFDALAEISARTTRGLIRVVERFDRGRVDGAVAAGAARLLAIAEGMRAVQTGQVGNYLLMLVVGGACVAGVLAAVSFAR